MWQTDIFTFRLGGKNAYLIGFIDDHSRYIVGLDVFRSQTAEHVLEALHPETRNSERLHALRHRNSVLR
jgi:transposase InsO family protein